MTYRAGPLSSKNRLHVSIRGVVRRSAALLRKRNNARIFKRLISGRTANLDDIASFLAGKAIPIRAPLILISQAQRSGGSLLNQLFDGHPTLAAYPGELRFGYEVNDEWPALDVRCSVEKNFRLLLDLKLARLMRHGYRKGGGRMLSPDGRQLIDRNTERHRFFLVPRVQYLIFKHLFENDPPTSQRDILNCFFTAAFNSWLDYQGLIDNKRWITAFAPRLALEATATENFFQWYSDGRLIQIIRGPQSWFASAKRQRSSVVHDKDLQQLVNLWKSSAESMLRNKSRFGDRVIILTFEDLIGRTEATMRRLARELSIDYAPSLVEPTFNGRLIAANSSFGIEPLGLVGATLTRGKTLSEDERSLIEYRCAELHHKVLERSLQIENSP